MDGIFQFRFAKGYGYYARQPEANSDRSFLEKQARLYCGLSYLESQHVPIISQYRRVLSKKMSGYKGIFPGLEKLCPGTSVGASMGYACDGHNDSSFRGLTESIFWSTPRGFRGQLLPAGEKWTFANAEAGLLFDLGTAAKAGGACIYIPGSVMHNSMPTKCGGHTAHQGIGFVLVKKAVWSKDSHGLHRMECKLIFDSRQFSFGV
jgi:hypothetical protein